MSSPTRLRHEGGTYLPGDAPVRGRIDEILREAGIGLAVVHGSRVRGKARADSDLDVGLLSADAKPLSYAAMGTVALDLSDALAAKVDVSDLSTPDAIFRYEVAACARLLYEDRPDAFTDFLARAMIDYCDIRRFLPELIAGAARGPRRISKGIPPDSVDRR